MSGCPVTGQTAVSSSLVIDTCDTPIGGPGGVRRALPAGARDRVVVPADVNPPRAPARQNGHDVAELDGELAGSGLADRSDMAGRFGVAPTGLSE